MTATCTVCKVEKSKTEFHRAPRNRTGVHSYCKPCSSVRHRERFEADPVKRMNAIRFQRYGITEAQFHEMLLEQDGRCAICREVPDKQLYIDHCHTTNRVRGLLCQLCNSGIGQLGDCALRVKRAAAYLVEASV